MFRHNQQVTTPDGKGIFVAPFNDADRPDETLVLVAIKVRASGLGDEELARLCARYPAMKKDERIAYKKKAVFPVNRVYLLEEISQ